MHESAVDECRLPACLTIDQRDVCAGEALLEESVSSTSFGPIRGNTSVSFFVQVSMPFSISLIFLILDSL